MQLERKKLAPLTVRVLAVVQRINFLHISTNNTHMFLCEVGLHLLLFNCRAR